MKIGFGQINTTVGDFKGNQKLILEAYHQLKEEGAELVIFPELALTGYFPRDLIYKSHFVEDNQIAIQNLAREISYVPALVGFIQLRKEKGRNCYYNAVAWCQNGQILEIGYKCLLPSYDVFDETRYFLTGEKPLIYQFKGKKIGVAICEDIWTKEFQKTFRQDDLDPVEIFFQEKVDLLLNLSASPWHFNKTKLREGLLGNIAKRLNCPIIYCNLVGGNDELLFDGQSLAVLKDGTVKARLLAFKEDLDVVDIENTSAPELLIPVHEETESIYDGLVMGMRDYAHKLGFRQAVVGLSGGVDSAVVAALAAEALGPENIFAYNLPSEISSESSKEDALLLAKNLGINFEVFPIKEIIDGIEKTLISVLAGTPRDETEENIQARVRGLLLMAVSNKKKAILLSTGNKSELAVGYCTLYGDMAGGLAVISDLIKTRVYDLAYFINKKMLVIPQQILEKEPSAELRVNQKDTDTLPPYELLDPILCYYIEDHMSADDIIKRGFAKEIVDFVVKRIDLNEYKRKQMPIGLRITPNAFGIGRRMPIVQKYLK